MKLKNKYSKQNIYSNQKFEDQIWYNQQIMTFLNFLQLPEKCFPPKFFRKTLSWKPSQIFLWLESVFRWPTFLMANKYMKVWKVIFRKPLSRKTNTIKRKNTFLETKSNFSLTGKCFPLTTFPDGKQTQESLENDFPKTIFRETNMV